MKITYAEAINKALHDELKSDSSTLVFGLGVADAKGIFGTTLGLREKFGSKRVFDIPLSENALTGAALGMALQGLKPIMVHQRADFIFTAAEQIINQIAKTFYTSGGDFKVPLVIRMIVGRGWGQGPTHAQSPHSLFANVPGLKIVLPSTPEDAYCMLRKSIQDPNPILFIEHRWLYQNETNLDELNTDLPLELCSKLSTGSDLTFVGLSLGAIDGLKIAAVFSHFGLGVDLINLRSVVPLDIDTIINSVQVSKKIALLDIAPIKFGVVNHISEQVMRFLWGQLKYPPLVFGLMNVPVPSSPFLAKQVYPSNIDIITKINYEFRLGINEKKLANAYREMWPTQSIYEDQPDKGLVGPF